jgi:transcriptional regulator with XRE-family HTH domain
MKTERNKQVLMLIAKNVRHYRIGAKISQEELAWQCQIDRTYISKIERGIANPTILILIKISEVLGVNPQDLIFSPTIALNDSSPTPEPLNKSCDGF